jgi:hypothetical protein
MTLSYREKILIMILIVAAVLYLGIQFMITPAFKSYVSTQSVAFGLGEKKFLVENKISASANIGAALQKSQTKALDAAKPFLPTLDSDVLNLWVSNIAASKGLSIKQIAITQPKVTDIQSSASKIQSTNYPIGDFANIIKGIQPEKPPITFSASNNKSNQSAVLMSEITLTMKDNNNAMPDVPGFLDAVIAQNRTAEVSSFTVSTDAKNQSVFTCTLDCYSVQKLDDSDHLTDWNLPAPQGKPFR